MQRTNRERVSELRLAVDDFLRRRLEKKLEAIKGSSDEEVAERQAETDRFSRQKWVKDAARRARQIQFVTHPLKATHPSLKITSTTNLYARPEKLHSLDVVGTHVLGDDFHIDVSGSAGALDVYAFLTVSVAGESLIDLACRGDIDLADALSDDRDLALEWMEAFSEITTSPLKQTRTSGLSKQIYWPATDRDEPQNFPDVHQDEDFHLLSPAYSSPLAYRVHLTIDEHTFGEKAKAARQAKAHNQYSEHALHSYPSLAVQRLGGSKPQNISWLNKEMGGANFLLVSLPPVWSSAAVKPVLGVDSIFKHLARRKEVRWKVHALSAFLKKGPPPNIETREHRDSLVEEVIDQVLQLAAGLQSLEPGWSQAEECRLNEAERQWLDPQGAALAADAAGMPRFTEVARHIGIGFASWMNLELSDKDLPMGAAEHAHWRKLMENTLINDDWMFIDDN